MKNDTLTRYAAVIPVLVKAGCEPTPFMRAAMFDDDMKPKTVGKMYREPIIAVLEQWFHQTAVPWADCEEGVFCISPNWDEGVWVWHVDGKVHQHPDPTEANIQCLEALAEVIGASNE